MFKCVGGRLAGGDERGRLVVDRNGLKDRWRGSAIKIAAWKACVHQRAQGDQGLLERHRVKDRA